MSTWLSNEKMSPNLVQRLEASIRGETGKAARKRPHSLTFLRRIIALGCVTSIGVTGYISYRTSQQEIASLRAELKSKVQSVRPSHISAELDTIEDWLLRAGKTWKDTANSQDFVAPAVLQALKTRPSVYIRGNIAQFQSGAGITQTAFESVKDAFLLCLMSPPASENEKVLLESVLLAYHGGDRLNQRVGSVERLHDLFAAVPLAETNWMSRVEDSTTLAALKLVEQDFLVAEQQAAVRTPELLLYVVDENKAPEDTSEFDGASRHKVRIGLVDLKTSQELLRFNREADPSWISEQSRLRYAQGLDSCKLGREVRQSLETSVQNPVAQSGGQ